MVKGVYQELAAATEEAGLEMPRNTGGKDLVNRKLDCAVVRMLHDAHEESGEQPFDTVRAAFFEGEPLYKNTGFAAQTHIQICVRDHRSILGYFRPLDGKGRPRSFK